MRSPLSIIAENVYTENLIPSRGAEENAENLRENLKKLQ
jgi:hypothetical protein